MWPRATWATADGTAGTVPLVVALSTLRGTYGLGTTQTIYTATANCNLVTVCGSSVVTPVWAKSGQAIKAYGQSYGSGSAPGGGSYNAYVLVEQL